MDKIFLCRIALVGSLFLSLGFRQAHATSKSAVVGNDAVTLFQNYCLTAPPGFSEINRRASTAGYKIFQDRTIPHVMHQKDWLVPGRPGGVPLLLSVESGNSRDGTESITVCGVSALGVSGPGLKQALSSDVQLGQPTKVVDPAPHGGTEVFWSVHFPGSAKTGDASVMLAYGVPGMRVTPINLIYKQKR